MRVVYTENKSSSGGADTLTTTTYKLTQKGVVIETLTEIVMPEETEEDDTIYDNEKNQLSDFFNAHVYEKAINVTSDGHRIYSFNEEVIITSKFKFECDSKGITEDYFIINHNVSNIKIDSVNFIEIDDYSEGSRLKIVSEDRIIVDFSLDDAKNGNLNKITINLNDYYREKIKYSIYITGNTNEFARGKLLLGFRTEPEDGINIDDYIDRGPQNEETQGGESE